jgi:hypothetical protein
MKKFFAKYDRYIEVETSNPLPNQKPLTGFTIIPDNWLNKLRGHKCKATPMVAIYLLRQGRLTNWQPVKVTNVAMRKLKIDRWSKADALHELEALKLIKVWRGGSGRGRSVLAVFLVRGE